VAGSSAELANPATTATVILGREAPRWLAAGRLAAGLVADNGDVFCCGGWPADPHMQAAA